MTPLHYAVGDVHGRDDLLEVMHERIAADRQLRHANMAATIIHLGDYIDRGLNSLGVIDRLMRGLPGFEVVCLKGNHEAMMLNCLETDDRQAWWMWLRNGGDATLASFGIPPQFGVNRSRELSQALGPHRIAWLRALPLYHHIPGYLFVHAGVRPGRPLEAQTEMDLIWIRDAFLESEDDFGFRVVHGHTPAREPEFRSNRIGIDTGAVFTDCLTALAVGGPEGPRVVQVTRSDQLR
jgi:serine/threonine protein phosphatase 1